MWDPKDPREKITGTFDFSNNTSSVDNPVITVEVEEGVDPNPGDILHGGSAPSGAIVLQQFKGGIEGVTYLITCEVDAAGGDHFVETALLTIEKHKPA